MKYIISLLCLLSFSSYAMETEDISLLPNTQQTIQAMLPTYTADNDRESEESQDLSEYTLNDLNPNEWKKNTHTLNWSKKRLASIEGFKDRCIPGSHSIPPSFPFAQLTTIILAHNKLKKIHFTEFTACPNLQHLDLSNNEIADCRYYTNEPLHSLRSLTLSGNLLPSTNIGFYFNLCSQLKHLDLSRNKIGNVAWQNHSVWPRLSLPNENATDSLPTINLIGNTIETTDREWLKNRYLEEKNRLQKSIEFEDKAQTACCFGTVGTVISSIVGIPAAIACNPFIATAIPIACTLGCSAGFCPTPEYYIQFIRDAQIRLYFDEKDTEQATTLNKHITSALKSTVAREMYSKACL